MKTLSALLFFAMCLLQWFIPGKMIVDSERVAITGTRYKFMAQPIDPYDPFRGRYITLSFRADHCYDTGSWAAGERVNVRFDVDSAGFAVATSLTREAPAGPFLATRVNYTAADSVVYFDLPFDRFYMKESKAPAAERYYADATRDSARTCYGLVSIADGKAVLLDVLVDDRPINEIVAEENNRY